MLCSKLLNSCVPDTIDERALNLPAEAAVELPPKEALQNSNLCIHAASALGCAVSAVSAQDILEGRQDAVRCCVWEFIKLGALKVRIAVLRAFTQRSARHCTCTSCVGATLLQRPTLELVPRIRAICIHVPCYPNFFLSTHCGHQRQPERQGSASRGQLFHAFLQECDVSC